MTSLDGYSLNKKMDAEFDKINERIEAVHYRIESEMEYIKENFQKLTKASAKKKEAKKDAVTEDMQQNKRSKKKAAV
mgnify:CR=1 FL=1